MENRTLEISSGIEHLEKAINLLPSPYSDQLYSMAMNIKAAYPECEMTELERHLVNHYRNSKEPFEKNEHYKNNHLLQEFADGYKNPDSGYANTDEEKALAARFVEIVESDIRGEYSYESEDFTNVIVKAMETFGL